MELATYEHVVKKEYTVASRGKKIFLWIITLLCGVGLLWTGLVLKQFPIFLGIVILGGFAVVMWMRRYSKIEYEYYIFEGTAVFSEIYGGASRHEKMTFNIKSCERVAPIADEKWDEFAKNYSADIVYSAISSENAENIYFAAFTSEKGKKCLVFFEMTATALKLFRTANPQAVIITKITE